MAKKGKYAKIEYNPMSQYNNVDTMVNDKMLRMQLTNIRKAKNITQKELSRLSGLSESCISNIETGENSSPTLRSLIKYTSALGVELYISMEPSNKSSNA